MIWWYFKGYKAKLDGIGIQQFVSLENSYTLKNCNGVQYCTDPYLRIQRLKFSCLCSYDAIETNFELVSKANLNVRKSPSNQRLKDNDFSRSKKSNIGFDNGQVQMLFQRLTVDRQWNIAGKGKEFKKCTKKWKNNLTESMKIHWAGAKIVLVSGHNTILITIDFQKKYRSEIGQEKLNQHFKTPIQ